MRVVVAEGDLVARVTQWWVLEGMKMKQPIGAHRSGTVTNLRAEPGSTVTSGAVLCTIDDAS